MPVKAEILQIPRVEDPRGNLSFIENGASCCPFDIERVYWIYDVPGGRERHGHAFRQARELIVALSGSFDVVLKDASGNMTRHHLARGYYGLYVPELTWRSIDNFSTNSVALVLSSTLYDPDDYIRDFDEYVSLAD